MSSRLCVGVGLVFFFSIIYFYKFFFPPESDWAALVCATARGDRGSRRSESSTSNFLPQLPSAELKVRGGERRLLFLYFPLGKQNWGRLCRIRQNLSSVPHRVVTESVSLISTPMLIPILSTFQPYLGERLDRSLNAAPCLLSRGTAQQSSRG